MDTFIETLKVDLTEEEIREAAEKLAQLTDEIEQKEAVKKSVASQFKADLDKLTADARVKATLVRNKWELRPVECHVEHDYDHGIVYAYRDDTGEMIRERPMTNAEKQAELDLREEQDEGEEPEDSER